MSKTLAKPPSFPHFSRQKRKKPKQSQRTDSTTGCVIKIKTIHPLVSPLNNS